ncbi:MAG: ABC transporter permease [Ruminococcaceae bacterium]|nr:ABC transporter permease [Oscillospiraceae bacterium]
MKTLNILIRRNIKLFFKDKGMFFTSLITPLILLVLYATFLGNVFEDSFRMAIPEGMKVDDNILSGIVGGQLLSSLLAVSCVTVAFCSNMLMVQDKVTGAASDISMTPVKGSTLAFGYYISSFISTMIISLVALAAGLIYIGVIGWYLTFTDLLLIVLDVFLLVMFGTALSSVINHFLSTQGQISAVGSIVSSMYGFICGAYMPISSFGDGVQKVVSFLPGTYATSLLRNHCMRSALDEFEASGIPAEIVEGMADTVDCNLYFFDKEVSVPIMYLVLGTSVVLLVTIYVIINYRKNRKKCRI